MAKPFTWSWSALQAWETCPRQFGEVRIKKAWPDEKGEAAKWGTQVHIAMEYRLKDGTALPTWAAQWEPLCQKLLRAGPLLNVEHKVALTEDLRPTEFFARDVWVRAIADVSIFSGPVGFTLDWKTGKRKPDTMQLRLSAAINLCHRPHLERQTIQYAWLKEGTATTETLGRADVAQVWQEILPRVNRMRAGIAAQEFEPKPSGLCRQYCSVLSCEHNGRRK